MLVSEISTWLFARSIFTQPVESTELGGFQESVDMLTDMINALRRASNLTLIWSTTKLKIRC